MHPFLQALAHYPDSIYVHHSKIEEQLPMHSHKKHQISYVEGGVAFLNTKNNSFFFPARHFIWIPAGLEHNVTSRTSVKMVHNLFFPADLIPENEILKKAGIFPVSNLLMEMINYTQRWNGDILKTDAEAFEFLIALRNIILEVAKTPFPVVLPTTTNEMLRPILKYIHLNVDQPLYLEEVAAHFGYSARSLSRLFQKNIETSFLQYVKLTRIIKSIELLLKTDLSISEVAYASGYNSLSAFSYAFNQIVNQSPAAFKKQSL